MMQKFIEAGYEIVDFEDKAEIYVINTCTVTNIADKKSRQMIRRVKQQNKNAILVAVGCYVQVAKEKLEEIDDIDLILGTKEKRDIVKYVEEYLEEKEKIISVSNMTPKDNYEEFGLITHTERNRAVIKVEDGCNQFCTYCIIPYARGRVRSRIPEHIIKEIEKISKNGIKEVVLTGINLTAYGTDFAYRDTEEQYKEEKSIDTKLSENYENNKQYEIDNEENKIENESNLDIISNESKELKNYRLIDLLEDINKVPKIKRIRLGSLEPTIITDDFVERLSKLEKICDHFHLSLQSGCTETLKRMNRKYTANEIEEAAARIRKYFPNAALTADIIVGFPGETDEEFNKTYELLKRIKLYKIHVFKYSKREGTKAAIMEKQVDGNIKEERSNKLLELSDKYEEEFNNACVGKTLSVLFEEQDEEYIKGHTTNYRVVKVKLKESKKNLQPEKDNEKELSLEKRLENEIANVKVTKAEGLELIGELTDAILTIYRRANNKR